MSDPSTATDIELNGTETIVTTVALGAQVQDDATVSSTNPFRSEERRVGKECSYRVTANGSGEKVSVGNDSSATAALAAGSYSYTVHYSGGGSYHACERRD